MISWAHLDLCCAYVEDAGVHHRTSGIGRKIFNIEDSTAGHHGATQPTIRILGPGRFGFDFEFTPIEELAGKS